MKSMQVSNGRVEWIGEVTSLQQKVF